MVKKTESLLIELDEPYVLKLQQNERGQYSGEVVRQKGPGDSQATHLFDVPPQATPELVEVWAQRALQAYREG